MWPSIHTVATHCPSNGLSRAFSLNRQTAAAAGTTCCHRSTDYPTSNPHLHLSSNCFRILALSSPGNRANSRAAMDRALLWCSSHPVDQSVLRMDPKQERPGCYLSMRRMMPPGSRYWNSGRKDRTRFEPLDKPLGFLAGCSPVRWYGWQCWWAEPTRCLLINSGSAL